MSKRYPGALITKTPVVPTSLSAPGIWSLSDQAAAQATNTWPFPRDPQFKNVTMLLHGDGSAGPVAATGVGAGVSTTVTNFNADASTNNFNVTINGDAKSNNFTPYQGSGYYSNIFNASTDRLTLSGPNLSSYTDFTFECWVNFNGFGSDTKYFLAVSGGSYYQLVHDSSAGISLRVTGYTSVVGQSSNSGWSIGTWYHVALVKSGSSYTIYRNGISIATNTYGSALPSIGIGFIGGYDSTTGLNAYMSNIRITNTAVYTAAFTPPVASLTAITGTQLLTAQSNRFIDNSSNAYALTVVGTPSVSPAIPFTLPSGLTTYGSGYFDGTGDFLTELTATTALNLSSGDWSISFWVYKTATANGSIVNLYNSAGNTSGLSIWIGSGGVKVDNGVSGGVQAGTVVVNAWSYIEVIRSSGTTTIYVNGVSAGTTTQTPNASQFGSFGSAADGTLPHQGYITDLRIVKGTALSSSVPTSPVTAVSGTSLLTTQYNGGGNNSGFKDSSQFNFPITRNGNTTQGTFTPYGANWSNYFDGSGDYLTTASSSAFNIGTNSFCIEFWVYTSSFPSGLTAVGLVSASYNTNVHVLGFNTNSIRFYIVNSYVDSNAINLNAWNHIACVRNGTSAVVYINGVAGTAATLSGTGANSALYIGSSTHATSETFTGYLSNVRFVNGSAVYTSNFTPSTTPFTAITNTQLLTCQSNRFIDNSSNAFAITKVGDTSVQRFSPFAPLTVYNPTTYGGSAYFDGSGDYLTTPSSADFGFSTGDFTVECWVYPLSSAAQRLVFFSNDMNNLDIGFSPANTFQYYNGGVVNTGISAASRQWFHFAASRTSGTTSVYVNGVRTNNVADTSSTSTRSVLVASSSGTYPFNGYINDVRVIKGTGIYSGTTITVPTAPLTAVTNTKLLLNYTNAGILDNSMMNDLETVGNAAVSTTVKKYGAASMYFDGNGDNLSTPTTPNLNMGTGNWTIECWVYILSRTLNYPLIFGNNNGSYTTGALALVNSNADSASYNDRFCLSVKDHLNAPTLVASSTNSSNTWYHLAVVRNGTSLVMYRDGTSVASATISSGLGFDWGKLGSRIGGGNWDGAQSYFNGYIDDLRITNGVARYTANFTAPDQAFPNG